jgi:hypothetical protein
MQLLLSLPVAETKVRAWACAGTAGSDHTATLSSAILRINELNH